MTTIPTYHRGSRNFGTGYDMMQYIEELEEQMAVIEEMGNESLNALPDCLMRLAPALVENDELKANLAKAVDALRPFVDYINEEYRNANPNAKFVLEPWHMGGGGWIGAEDLVRAKYTIEDIKENLE